MSPQYKYMGISGEGEFEGTMVIHSVVEGNPVLRIPYPVHKIETPVEINYVDTESFSKFVLSGIKYETVNMARFSVEPNPTFMSFIPAPERTYGEIASYLAKNVNVVDKNVAKPDISTPQGLVEAASLASALAKVAADSNSDLETKKELTDFTDTITSETGALIVKYNPDQLRNLSSKIDKKSSLLPKITSKVLLATQTLAILSTACGTQASSGFTPVELASGLNLAPAVETIGDSFSPSAVEQFLSDQGSAFKLVDKSGNSLDASLNLPVCAEDGSSVATIDFQASRKTDSDLNLGICGANLNLNGISTPVSILVENDGGKPGQAWIIFGQGSSDNNKTRSWGYLVPLKDGSVDLSVANLRQITELTDVTGATTMYITDAGPAGKGMSSTWTFKYSDVLPPYISGVIGSISGGLPVSLQELVPLKAPEATQAPIPPDPDLLNRTEPAQYTESKYESKNGTYPPDIVDKINQYTSRILPNNTLIPYSVTVENNPGKEDVVIINFTEDTKVNGNTIARIFDYLLSQAIAEKTYTYQGMKFIVKPPTIVDTTIGLIPSPGVPQQNPSFTEWSISTGSPNNTIIHLWGDGDMPRIPTEFHNIYPNKGRFNSYQVATELCQASSRVVITDFGGADPSDISKLNMEVQEAYCNSNALTLLLKKEGFNYNDYVNFMNTNVQFTFKTVSATETYPAFIVDEATYNGIPQFNQYSLGASN